MALYYQNPCEGRRLTIRWERTGLMAVYRLRRTLTGPTGEQTAPVYEGRALSFTDSLPAGARSVQYHLSSSGFEQAGELLAVHQSGPPRFLSEGRDLGKRCGPFSIPYEAEDTFPDARLSVQISLDDTVLERLEGLFSPVRLAAAVDEKTFSRLAVGSNHTLRVTLQNEFGHSSSLSFHFTASSDETAGCTFYLLRDGTPVAKKTDTGPFLDYRAAGSHRYQVRITDPQGGFCDSNEVTVVSRIESALLAPFSHPEQAVSLSLQSGGPPLRRSLLQPQNRLFLFEGREYAALEQSGQLSQRFTLHALVNEEDYRQLKKLADSGETVLYRDPSGNCMAAAIDMLSAAFSAQGAEIRLQLAQLCESEEVTDD